MLAVYIANVDYGAL